MPKTNGLKCLQNMKHRKKYWMAETATAKPILVKGYVKHAGFDNGQSSKHKEKKPFAAEHLHYNEQKDCYYCPMGQAMHLIGSHKKMTSTGFEQTIKRYQAQNCNGCPLGVFVTTQNKPYNRSKP